MNERRVKVPISDLRVNVDNPRYSNTARDQQDAIVNLLKDQEEKIVNLAADIAENGLNAMENIAVTRGEDSSFLVREGNRRVAAIKLLEQPNLIETIRPASFKRLKELQKKFLLRRITDIECILYLDETLLNRFIELKHTGENDGVGVTQWNAMQKRRFEEQLGKHVATLKAIDFILSCKEIPDAIKNDIHKIAITNLERLINDSYVKAELGINTANQTFSVDINNPARMALFSYILNDLIFNDDFNVKKIYYKSDRREYIDEAKQNLEFAISDGIKGVKEIGTETQVGVPQGKPTDISDATLKAEKEQRRRPLSTKRKTMIPRSCVINIKHARLNKIYHELSEIDVDEKQNACAVLFRTFVELSVDVYCQKNQVSGYSIGARLAHKIKTVSEYMRANNIMTRNELKPIEMLSDNPSGVSSVNTFNAYVHNPNVIPLPDSLKSSWDSVEGFMKKLF